MNRKNIVIFFLMLVLSSSVYGLDINDVVIDEVNEGFFVHYPISEEGYLDGSFSILGNNYDLSTSNNFFIKNLECFKNYDIIVRNSTHDLTYQKITLDEKPDFEILEYNEDINYVKNFIFELKIDGTKYSNYEFKLNGDLQNYELLEQNDEYVKYKIILDNFLEDIQTLEIKAKSCFKQSDEKTISFIVDKTDPVLFIDEEINELTDEITFSITPSEIGTLKIQNGSDVNEYELDSTDEIEYRFELEQFENIFYIQFKDKAGNKYESDRTINHDSRIETFSINELDREVPMEFLYSMQSFTGKTDPDSTINLYLLDGSPIENICNEDDNCDLKIIEGQVSGEYELEIDQGIIQIESQTNFDIYDYANTNGMDVIKYDNYGSSGAEFYFVGHFSFDLMNIFINKEFKSDSNGNFEFNSYLAAGENEYLFEITDPSGNKLYKSYNITRLATDLIWDLEPITGLPDLTVEHLDSDLPLQANLNLVFDYLGTGDAKFNIVDFDIPSGVQNNDLIINHKIKKMLQTQQDGKEKVYVNLILEFNKDKIKEIFDGDYQQDIKINLSSMQIYTDLDKDSSIVLPKFEFHMKGLTGYMIPPKLAKDMANGLRNISTFTQNYILDPLSTALTIDFGVCLGALAIDFLESVNVKQQNKINECNEIYDGEICKDPDSVFKESMYVCNRITCPEVPNIAQEDFSSETISYGEDFRINTDTGFTAVGNVEGENNDYDYVISWSDGSKSETLETTISKRTLCRYAGFDKDQCDDFIDNPEAVNAGYVSYMNNLLQSNYGRYYSSESPHFDQTKRLINISKRRVGAVQNPYANIVSSLETVCIPGMYANINKYNTIIDEVATCFESLSETDQDFAFCQQLLGYHVCDLVSGVFNYVLPSNAANDFTEDLSVDMSLVSDESGSVNYVGYFAELTANREKYSSSYLDTLLDAGFGTGTGYNEKVNQICVAAIDYDWSSGNFFDFATEGILDNALSQAAEEVSPEVMAWGKVRQNGVNLDGTLQLRYDIYVGAVSLDSIKEISLTCHDFDDDSSYVGCTGAGNNEITIEKNYIISEVTNSFDYIYEQGRYLYNAIKVEYYDNSKDKDVVKYFKFANLIPSDFLAGISCSIKLGSINCESPIQDNLISVNTESFFGSKRYTRTIPENQIYVDDDLYLTFYLEDMHEDAYLEIEYDNIFATDDTNSKKQYLLEYNGNDKGFFVIELLNLESNNVGLNCDYGPPYKITNFLNINVDNLESIDIQGYDSDHTFNIIADNDGTLIQKSLSVNDINNDLNDDNSGELDDFIGKNPKIQTNLKWAGDNSAKLTFNLKNGEKIEKTFQASCNDETYDIVDNKLDISWRIKRDTDNDNLGDSPFYYFNGNDYEIVKGNYGLNVIARKRDKPFVDLIYPLYMLGALSFDINTPYYFISLPRKNNKIQIDTIKTISGESSGAYEISESALISYINQWIDKTNSLSLEEDISESDIVINNNDLASFEFKNDIMDSEQGFETSWSIKSTYDNDKDSDELLYLLRKNDNIDSELDQVPIYFIAQSDSISID